MAVMIGIDPHKRSHTAGALNGTDEVLDSLRVDARADQVHLTAGGWGGTLSATRTGEGSPRSSGPVILQRLRVPVGSGISALPIVPCGWSSGSATSGRRSRACGTIRGVWRHVAGFLSPATRS
jgi:hypothetical protein